MVAMVTEKKKNTDQKPDIVFRWLHVAVKASNLGYTFSD